MEVTVIYKNKINYVLLMALYNNYNMFIKLLCHSYIMLYYIIIN